MKLFLRRAWSGSPGYRVPHTGGPSRSVSNRTAHHAEEYLGPPGAASRTRDRDLPSHVTKTTSASSQCRLDLSGWPSKSSSYQIG
jgi:hypothetical protein